MPLIQGGFSLTGTDTTRLIGIQQNPTLRMFENISVIQSDQFARALGLYGDVVMGQELKGVFASMTTPRHQLSSRKPGCVWRPKGGVRMNVEEFPTCPVEYMAEQCPDVFYGTCFERLFAPGNGVRDLAGTAEGQAILAQLFTRIFQGLGNDFFDLYNFANHPLIALANQEGFYKVDIEQWDNYIDQMLSGECGGIITLLDELAAMGQKGYDMDIPNADIDEAKNKYTGNFRTLVADIIANGSPELQVAVDTGVQVNGTTLYPIILATTPEFNNYREYISQMAPTNELSYRYMLTGMDGVTDINRNVLRLDNMPVVRWDAHVPFDRILGTQSHRVAVVLPGAFGVLHDVSDLKQWSGMGMMVEQSTRLADLGKIFMSTTFRWGAGISDTDFVSMASNILHP